MTIQSEVREFFHDFTLHVLQKAGADPSSPRSVKMAMLDNFEAIYPQFEKTDVFRRCYGKELHEQMVEEYKKNFTLLLEGKVP